MKKSFLLLICLCVLSCDNKEKPNDVNQVTQEKYILTKADVSKIDYIDFILDAKAEKAIGDWDNYIELQDIITKVNEADLSFFKDDNTLVKTFINAFRAGLPESINTASVISRISALETKIHKLENTFNLSNTKKENLLFAIKELLESSSNLNFQINKKFEKESQNILKP